MNRIPDSWPAHGEAEIAAPPVVLAHEAPFALPPLHVEPALRRIVRGDGADTIVEPLVMQVLVALARAHGDILTRDELVDRCWDGRIVGDDSIARVIGMLRKLGAEFGQGAFTIETITKVGYRLLAAEAAAGDAPAQATATQPIAMAPTPFWSRKLSRRAAAGGLVAIGVGFALTFPGLRQPAQHVPDPRALELYQRGLLLRRSTTSENVLPALSYFKQAVTIDPDFADAWGAIAVFYASSITVAGLDNRAPPMPQLARSAAQRALALDPDQGEALLALISIEPERGRLIDHERRLRLIVRNHPDLPLASGALGMLLGSVGRYEEAIAAYLHMLKVESSLPLGFALLAHSQHCAGRELEADATLDAGFARFPAHFLLWMSRFSILIGSKRYRDAAAFARETKSLPVLAPPQFQAFHVGIADALATGKGRERQVTILRGLIAANIENLGASVTSLAELGSDSVIFDALEAYYLGGSFGGRQVLPPGPQANRATSYLFLPEVLARSDDPRHARLLTQLGLEDYWRKSGSQPDYRRG